MKKSLVLSLFLSVILLISLSFTKTSPTTETFDKLDIIDSDLIKKDSQYKLVFFGYAGCYHFCDPRLRQIDPIYKELKKSLDIKTLFIDISIETTHASADRFAKDVNVEFESISPDAASIRHLQKKFQDVYIRKMPDGEYMHSGFLYLLKHYKQKYYLVKTYPEFINTQAIITDIKNRSVQ